MGGGWVFLAIFIGIAVLSAISHVIRSQQQAAQTPRRREREREQRRRENVQLASSSDQDRFVAEIERLRKKAASKAVPTIQPKKKKPSKLEDLPVATVITPKAIPISSPVATPVSSVAPIAEIARIADVAKPAAAGTSTAGKITTSGITVGGRATTSTQYSRDLMGMLKSHQALPMAVILQEILGERRGSNPMPSRGR